MQIQCKLRLEQLQSEYLDMKFEANKKYMGNLSLYKCWINVCTVVSMASRLTAVFKATVGLLVKKLRPRCYCRKAKTN